MVPGTLCLGSVMDPDSIRSEDPYPDPYSESGSEIRDQALQEDKSDP
jgi:hypothetical protein